MTLIKSPQEIPATAAEDIRNQVWLKGNLVEVEGQYFLQLTLHSYIGTPILEAAINYFQSVGFEENEWQILRESSRFCLREKTAYANAQQAYIALSGLVWDTCEKTHLSYGEFPA